MSYFKSNYLIESAEELMKNKRLKEILKLIIKQLDRRDPRYPTESLFDGMCSCLTRLVKTGVINIKEQKEVHNYICANRPEIPGRENYLWWWPSHEIERRKQWLEEQINNL